jgi:methylated-DNA-[protein]-cysteine S-methyltransferase
MSDNVIEQLTHESATERERLARLQEQLVARASDTGDLDVTYHVVDSPVGHLLLAATDAGLVRVAYATEGHDGVLDALGRLIGSRVLKSPKRFDAVARELDAYFDGRLRAFDTAVDLRLAHGFRLGVLQHLRDIPYGRTESYREVAAAAGSPRAVRAVGSACATNPLPIVVPCHRVVRSDGSMGGYLGGIDAKRWLLHLEAAA